MSNEIKPFSERQSEFYRDFVNFIIDAEGQYHHTTLGRGNGPGGIINSKYWTPFLKDSRYYNPRTKTFTNEGVSAVILNALPDHFSRLHLTQQALDTIPTNMLVSAASLAWNASEKTGAGLGKIMNEYAAKGNIDGLGAAMQEYLMSHKGSNNPSYTKKRRIKESALALGTYQIKDVNGTTSTNPTIVQSTSNPTLQSNLPDYSNEMNDWTPALIKDFLESMINQGYGDYFKDYNEDGTVAKDWGADGKLGKRTRYVYNLFTQDLLDDDAELIHFKNGGKLIEKTSVENKHQSPNIVYFN